VLRSLPFAALVAVVATVAAAAAHEFKLGGLEVDRPYARATASLAKAGVAYLTVRNTGTADDRLLAARTAAAETAALHSHVHEGGIMRMRAVEGGIALPAGEAVELKPGGLHVMLFGLKGPLRQGESFPLTLVFEQAGEVTVEVKVEAMTAGAGHGDYGGHGDHGHGQKMK
jgi:hypothetical protein